MKKVFYIFSTSLRLYALLISSISINAEINIVGI